MGNNEASNFYNCSYVQKSYVSAKFEEKKSVFCISSSARRMQI